MKTRIDSRGAGLLLACLIGLGWAVGAAGAQKTIRLRNETLVTSPEPAAAGRAKAAEPAVSGLYLVQLTGPLAEAWRAPLKAAGVEVLRYVPDDCYIARVQGVPLQLVRRLPFVHWVGPLRPEHKLLGGLGAWGAGDAGAVSVLLAPGAPAAEVDAIRRSLVGPQESRTRAGLVLRGGAARALARNLAESAQVLWIEPGPRMRLYDEISTKIVAGVTDTAGTRAAVHQEGFDGTGVTVAVADSGLCMGAEGPMHPDLEGRVDAFFFYGALDSAADEHSHGTHVAGIVAGNAATGETDEAGYLYGLGVAPGAHLVAQRLFDAEGGYQAPPSYGTLTSDALSAGAEIGSNSWGDDTQGRYDLSAMEFDALVRDGDPFTPGDQPYILEFSAGNAGPASQSVGSPAVAKNVIATGATDSERTEFLIYGDGPEFMADFSSVGPCEDGRIKPDVVAPGTWIASLRSPLGNDDNAWAVISDFYLYQGGTSQAGPHISGAAAVFVQWYRQTRTNTTPSPALVKAALINAAVDLASLDPAPSMEAGWGRVDLTQMIGSSRQYDFVDQSTLLKTGQSYERRLIVAAEDEPLKITLVYTDVPAYPGAIPALVNDLDLEVTGPDGTLYRGNQFVDGESVPNALFPDSINNVEGVLLYTPVPGEYIVRVRAAKVPQDARVETTAIDQDFALVISGALPPPGQGLLVLDRPAYTAPGVIRLTLMDPALQGRSSVSATVQSQTQTAPVTVTLRAGVSGTVFTGSVATAAAPAADDGRVHLTHGDWIRASYSDVFAGVLWTAQARADLMPPAASAATFTTVYGRILAQWTTDEESTSAVLYGTNYPLRFGATNRLLDTLHEVEITNFVYGVQYWCVILSTDAAGNTATNDNGGAGFTFTAQRPSTALLVDSYEDSFFAVPPLSGYTLAMNQTGVAYDFWDARGGNTPPLSVLRAYRAVVWRVSEFGGELGWTDWKRNDLLALSNYVAGGGSLLVASMEAVSRVETVGSWFTTNTLQVRSFAVDAGASRVAGLSGDPVGGGFSATLDYTLYEDWIKELMGMPADVSDTLTPTTNATVFLTNGFGQPVGIRSPRVGQNAAGRVIYLSIPLDAIPLAANGDSGRGALLKHALQWLAPPENNSTVEMDSPEYTLPSLVVAEVENPTLSDQATVAAYFTNTTLQAGAPAVFLATPRPGLFRGSVVLVATNGGPAGQLQARNGDQIQAVYVDPGSGSAVAASALVATDPPVISDLAAESGFLSAIISWETSKQADALVQYGESVFLGRSAYLDAVDTYHELLIDGLQPDRLYYYKVVSRDRAGNTAVDDNNGQLYTLQTQRPLQAPWADDMESGRVDWTVIDGEGSSMSWDYGTPANSQAVTAHSGQNAWGSDLHGRGGSEADTYLISPGVYLGGGNQITLRFWQNYDFMALEADILNYGELLIITNENTAPITLDAFQDDYTGDWMESEYDLTPYAGQVVYIAWHYVLFAMEQADRLGWLVDDASITSATVVPGMLVLTNNLYQGGFVLTGPATRSAQGNSLVVSNAMPGEYEAAFTTVPYYLTPAPEIVVLAPGETRVVSGQYTFIDSNHNGISDPWETRFLGGIDPSNTGAVDTDGDGMTDRAEFLAGTLPADPASRLAVSIEPLPAAAGWQVSWTGVAGRGYRVETSQDLRLWTPASPWERAFRPANSVLVPAAPGQPAQFFRVVAAP